jgi:hypothetical protein
MVNSGRKAPAKPFCELTFADDDGAAASATANFLIRGTAGTVRNAAHGSAKYGGKDADGAAETQRRVGDTTPGLVGSGGGV